ncbi:MAG: hypothetical protein M3463_14340 [Verrucomicrobiota bacterium]|nr:hypothetical protein [Verrucomicrobiota bacterium]
MKRYTSGRIKLSTIAGDTEPFEILPGDYRLSLTYRYVQPGHPEYHEEEDLCGAEGTLNFLPQ